VRTPVNSWRTAGMPPRCTSCKSTGIIEFQLDPLPRSERISWGRQDFRAARNRWSPARWKSARIASSRARTAAASRGRCSFAAHHCFTSGTATCRAPGGDAECGTGPVIAAQPPYRPPDTSRSENARARRSSRVGKAHARVLQRPKRWFNSNLRLQTFVSIPMVLRVANRFRHRRRGSRAR
jgi:hypothetical protein